MFRNKHSPLSSSNISLYTDKLFLLLPLCPYNYSRLSTLEAYIFPDPSRCAILVGMDRVRILHGTGTGILRTLIRQYLATVPGVSHYADEHVQFGGAGITVVDFD